MLNVTFELTDKGLDAVNDIGPLGFAKKNMAEKNMTWTIGCNHGNMWISWIFGFRMIRKVGFSLGFSLSK